MPIELKVPEVGESVTEVMIAEWFKSEGDRVERDEKLADLETEKATVELPAPVAGVLAKITHKKGDVVGVGEVIALIEEGSQAGKKAPPGSSDGASAKQPEKKEKKKAPAKAAESKADKKDTKKQADANQEVDQPRVMPAAQRLLDEHQLKAGDVQASGPGGRLLKEDVQRHIDQQKSKQQKSKQQQAEPTKEARPPAPQPSKQAAGSLAKRDEPAIDIHVAESDLEELVPMSMLRRHIAQRLVEAQQQAALLTTFNEVDMSHVMELRGQHRDTFQEKYGIKLGFMSFFVKAVIDALKRFPELNAEIREQSILYRDYYHIGIAIGGGKGLVVPVLRNAQRMSFAEIELGIADFAERARQNRIEPDELRGGTFTITNGGIYGSLLSTPIVNPPQSGILGMHAIQERPVAIKGQVVIRPIMYVALTYDHRIVDGREAVSFLKRIKDVLEEPSRMLLEI